MNENNLNHHDPETDALIEQLDALGSHDRTTPDAGFEQRLMDSISTKIAPTPLPIANAPIPQPNFMPGWKFNIAAALLIVGGVSLLLWTAGNASNLQPIQAPAQITSVSLEEDFDALYNLTDFASDLENDIDELDLLTNEMHTELSLPSVLMELSNTSLTDTSPEGSL